MLNLDVAAIFVMAAIPGMKSPEVGCYYPQDSNEGRQHGDERGHSWPQDGEQWD